MPRRKTVDRPHSVREGLRRLSGVFWGAGRGGTDLAGLGSPGAERPVERGLHRGAATGEQPRVGAPALDQGRDSQGHDGVKAGSRIG